LGRLDVRDELDGVERGTEELEQLAAVGPCCSILRPHSSRRTTSSDRSHLRQAGVPHPRTWWIAAGSPSPAPSFQSS